MRLTLHLIWLVVPLAASGHHSSVGVYDPDTIAEVEGELMEILWRNPHVRFTIRTGTGDDEQWAVEGASVSVLGRKGISPEILGVGNHIKVAGTPAIRGVNEMYMTNVLLPDGREVMMLPRGEPRWSNDTVLWSAWSEFPEADVRDAIREARSVFRVWTTDFDGDLDRRLWNESYPLTDAAQEIRSTWDPVDSPYVSCIKGMPSIMEQPYPLEFVERNGDIVLRIEEYDVVRTIKMNSSIVDEAPAPWGHSTGAWDGTTLVVTTSGISWPYFDQTGISLNETSILVERFTPASDGTWLDYTMTVTDPLIFTEPVVLARQWVWKPGESVKPFRCDVDQN